MFPRLGRGRQLFINNRMIEQGRSEARYGSHNLRRVLHQAKKHGLVLQKDQPWESPVLELLSNNVIVDPKTGKFRMWYSCFIRQFYKPLNAEVESTYVLYAESDDGLHWVKPKLGLHDYKGSKANNLCAVGEGCGIGFAGVMEDPDDPNPNRRFKLLAHGTVGIEHGTVIYFSPDGLKWTPCPHNPVLYARVDCGDSPTIMGCRDPRTGRFVAPIRPQDWFLSYPDVPTYRYDRGHPQGDALEATCTYRRIGLSFSNDFVQWSIPQVVLTSDLDDPPGTQFQGMTMCPYEGQYLGFLMMHYADGMNDTIDVQLAVSDDMMRWDRVGNRKPLIPIGDEGPWASKMVFAISATPLVRGDELWLYYNPHRTTHYCKHEDRCAAVGLAKLRRDGFISMHADGEGFLVTKPFTFEGEQLFVNADASAGSLRVQVYDERLLPIEGYLTAELRQDAPAQALTFPPGKPLAALQGRPIRLKFLMNNAHLYSFWIA